MLEALHTYGHMADRLDGLAAARPTDLAFEFRSGGSVTPRLTYHQLASQSRALACLIQRHVAPGARVVLAFKPGLEFVVGYFGCLYADVISIPTYAPAPRKLAAITAMARDAEAELLLSNIADASLAKLLPDVQQIIVDRALLDSLPPATTLPYPTGSMAHLQYTSGSTGQPKGVVVSHANILAECLATTERYTTDRSDIMVSWLPHFHDFGLIFGILHAVFNGIPSYLMSPASFVKEPRKWLELVSEVGGTMSASPNFGFEHCLSRIGADTLKELDLTSWRFLLNGAEPVRVDAMLRFLEYFAPCGLRATALNIGYGLAECTLSVSTKPWMDKPNFIDVDRAALGLGFAIPPSLGSHASRVVNCGKPFPTLNVRIRGEDGTLRGEGLIGEIVVDGPTASTNYYGLKPDAVLLRDPDGVDRHYKETGDLGFILDGDLYITGRVKDLIIMNGVNHSPIDIEVIVERASNLVKPGHAAAFSVTASEGRNAGGEAIVVMLELLRIRDQDPQVLMRTIKAAVSRELELPIDDIVLMPPGSLPKTTSGKIRRRESKRLYESGQVQRIVDKEPVITMDENKPTDDTSALTKQILDVIEKYLRDNAEQNAAPPDLRMPLSENGLSSVDFLELQLAIEKATDGEIDQPELMWDASSVVELALSLARYFQLQARRTVALKELS